MEKPRYKASGFACRDNVYIVHDTVEKKIIIKGLMTRLHAEAFAMMLNSLDLIHAWVTPGSGKWHQHTAPETIKLIGENIEAILSDLEALV